MKKDDQQRLMLNVIILVISGFILIFMLMGKFLSSSDPVSSNIIENPGIDKQDEISVTHDLNRNRQSA